MFNESIVYNVFCEAIDEFKKQYFRANVISICPNIRRLLPWNTIDSTDTWRGIREL